MKITPMVMIVAALTLFLPTSLAASTPPQGSTTQIDTPAGTYYLHEDRRLVVNEGSTLLHYRVEVGVWKESNGEPGLQRSGAGADGAACPAPPVHLLPPGVSVQGCGVIIAQTLKS